MLVRPRRRLAVALCAALLLAALPALLPTAAPLAAQTATPAPPTPAATAPSATPTPTSTVEELLGVDGPADWARELWQRFGWWAVPLALLAGLVWVVLKLLEGLGEGAKEDGKGLYNRVTRWRPRLGHDPGVRAYLAWLRDEYGYLQQIGIGTEPQRLSVATVYIPLRVVERDEAEGYLRRMRGEAEGAEDEPPLAVRPGGLRGARAGPTDASAFRLLSDAAAVARRRQRYLRQQARRALLDRLLRGPQRLRSPVPPVPVPRASGRAAPPPVPPELAPGACETRLLLLGGAGSGKTMTLRYAALCCAEAYLQRRPALLQARLGLVLAAAPLPIYVRLTEFAQSLPEQIDALPLAERSRFTGAPPERFLEWLDQRHPPPPSATPLSVHVQRGGCLLLLDGLDESGSEGRRAYLAELIGNLASKYTGNRYVVASRTSGYGGMVALPDFAERHLSPLDADEAQAMIGKWFQAVYANAGASDQRRLADEAAEQAAQLWAVIERNPRLLEMATNPLLATATALLQYNSVRLPDQRAKLYENLVDLLLDIWNKHKNKAVPISQVALSTQKRRLHHLALQMQLQPGQAREVTLARAQQWLRPQYERANVFGEEADRQIEQLLESLSITSGLLQRSRGLDCSYSFSHYTFQEYLAACGLDALDNRADEDDGVAFLLARAAEPRWRETLLLAAGYWSNGEQLPKTERLLAGLLARGQPDPALLAGAALADIGPVAELARLREETVVRLRALAFDPAACPGPLQRNAAATLLDRLDADARPALEPANDDYWATPIAPGPFVMGPGFLVYTSERREEPAFTAPIARRYALARFPVTNRLYARFMASLVDEKERATRRPFTWPGRSFRPGEGNHPVTGVGWRSAMAFAAWLDADLRERGVLGPGELIRLPLETEWERAAAYPVALDAGQPGADKRAYPWGGWPTGEDVAGPANTRESGIGGTSAVGIFPQGRADCGAEDMAGNVWEWCANAYQPYPLPEELVAEMLDTRKGIVQRGGGWRDNRSYAACAARNLDLPGRRRDLTGLRVARLFSL